MNTKHTPGPWIAEKQRNLSSQKDQFVIKTVEKDCVSDIIATTPWINKKTWHEANARLISAAPELLEYLKFVYDGYRERLSPQKQNEIKSLIAKAEGSES